MPMPLTLEDPAPPAHVNTLWGFREESRGLGETPGPNPRRLLGRDKDGGGPQAKEFLKGPSSL